MSLVNILHGDVVKILQGPYVYFGSKKSFVDALMHTEFSFKVD